MGAPSSYEADLTSLLVDRLPSRDDWFAMPLFALDPDMIPIPPVPSDYYRYYQYF
jgi:hypothetical protein